MIETQNTDAGTILSPAENDTKVVMTGKVNLAELSKLAVSKLISLTNFQFFEGKTDWNDIRWSGVGGLIGSILCFIFWNNNYIFYTNLCLIIIFVGKDLINHFKK